ncbi:MAG: thiamine-phosphate kinase [Planctomycetota bacterium]
MPSENDFVAALIRGLPSDRRLEVPVGDDAAVLRPPALRRTVITVDMLMEGVDFVLGPDCPPEAVGHKALAVSLSDLAAMGSRPEAAVVAVALPRRAGDAIGRGLQAGLAAAAAAHDVALAGGDTNSWDGPLVISTTLIGSVAPGAAWRRDGARAGDLLVASGAFGGSLLGRHLAVTPRCREAAVIAAGYTVHAAIDVSDGLSLDVARMMTASGTAAVLDLAAVPIHTDAVTMASRSGDGRSPLEHALGDGEDFELVLAMPPEDARRLAAQSGRPPLETPFTIIGEVVEGMGLRARSDDGVPRPLLPQGYQHDLAE